VLKFVIVVLLIAVAIYLLVRVIERRGIAPLTPPPPTRRGPIGPDDDDDFLWGLNKKRRHPDEG